ncbi:MAG: DUF4258 domain-containing protein [Anaerolineae bacterium]
MIIREVEDLLAHWERIRFSDHGLREAHKESLHAEEIFHAIFRGEILEHYWRRRRMLIVGPVPRLNLQIHVVCDYTDPREIVIVTVYVPDKPHWVNELVRNRVLSGSGA